MATLRFPYEAGGFMTVKVDRVISVAAVSGSAKKIDLLTDLPMASGQDMKITLEYKTAEPTADDRDALQDAIVEAAQTPGSCEIFRLIGDDQTAGFALAKTNGTNVTSA
tara:strand:- start:106 stop:432 length:327 start_codon:yes stop_codon:yes gene_type:complete